MKRKTSSRPCERSGCSKQTSLEEVQKVANKELNRLRNIQPTSPEFTVSRTYLEWLADLPWNTSSEDNNDIDHARSVLDKDHHGLDKVKMHP